MDTLEAVVQTRLPEGLTQKLKLHAIKNNVKLKDDIAEMLTNFIKLKPWLEGTWIKQPKTTPEFKPLTVKVPPEVGTLMANTAEDLEVSTSSLAYTAIDWFLNKK